MMKIIYKPLLTVAICFTAITSMAQNLDPTVVVDRAYEGKLIEVHKPVLEMAVPDSVFRFDLDFDYSVFDNPYKGSYEFKPYLLSMKPSASADARKCFYLKAGAGYRLHPELDVVWTPRFRNRSIGLDLYAGNRSYVGKYHDLDGSGKGSWSGYDVKSEAGADFSIDMDRSSLEAGIGYYGLAGGHSEWKRFYNALDACFNLSSKASPYDNRFYYELNVAYRYAGDDVAGAGPVKSFVSENVIKADATFGIPTRGSVFLFDAGADFVNCADAMRADAGQFYVTPHYVYRKGRFMADIGVKVAKILDSDLNDASYSSSGKEQLVYPDVNVDLILLRNALKMNLDITGGNVMNTYGSVIDNNHHLDFISGLERNGILDVTIERVNASIGLEGRVSSRFSYMMRAGFVSFANAMFDYVMTGEDSMLHAGVGYSPANRTFVETDVMWKSENIMASANISYSSYAGSRLSGASALLMPSSIAGEVSFEYNWKRRIYVGTDCSFASARQNSFCRIDGYADLGLYAEYVMGRGFSFWARGGNLLGMTICRNPLYAEKGAYFTIGICLNL